MGFGSSPMGMDSFFLFLPGEEDTRANDSGL